MEQWQLPEGWEWVPLSTIATDASRRDPGAQPDRLFRYVEISSIDNHAGIVKLDEVRSLRGSEAPSRARKQMRTNDVLLATTRPYLRNIALVPDELDGEICSTGFCVIRTREGISLPRYLYHACRSDFFVEQLIPKQRGASYPAVTDGDVYESLLPFPYPDDPTRSLETQRRIVARIEALLRELRVARELHETIVEDTDRLMDAVLADVYSQADDWDPKTIESFAQVKGGKRLPKGESFADAPTDHPYLRVIDFKDYSIDATEVKYLKPETYEKIQRYTISSDDVYISIAGTIGLVGTVPRELSGSNLTENAAKLVILPLFKQEVNTRYVVYYLASPYGRAQIDARTKMAGQPKLALMRIKTIEVPFPETSTAQLRIVKYVDTAMAEIREMQKTQDDDRVLLEQMEQAILAQAFRGGL